MYATFTRGFLVDGTDGQRIGVAFYEYEKHISE